MNLLLRLARAARGIVIEMVRPGDSDLSGRLLWRIGKVALTVVIVVTNLAGLCAVLAVTLLVVPLPAVHDQANARLVSAIAAFVYAAVAVPIGAFIGIKGLFRLRRWLVEDRPATPSEQRLVLSAPLRLAALQTALWLCAAAGFGVLNGTYSGSLGVWVALIVALTGVTTAFCAYLLTERLLRPVAARALANAQPGGLAGGGVATRSLLAWAFGSGVPVLGLGIVGVFALAGQRVTPVQLGVAIVVLCGTALTVGLLAVGLAARATADPIDSVRRALGRVQKGDFDVHVPVYDGTQVGQLQLGFNQMVQGLAERERIREAFGTYVDPEVADHILREGTSLSGEDVEVTIMFIDVRSFTAFAESHPAREVVATLNELFGRIVPIIHKHGGRVDKFIGDGLLAVFGAPRRQPDHADRALAAAVEIARATAGAGGAGGGLSIGVGLNSGSVVAGNVGAPGRVEFSVIGDPVNVAARVEAATRETGDTILVAERTRELLREERVKLVPRTDVTLKGKSEPVKLYAVELD
jgi:adenylate cyclase